MRMRRSERILTRNAARMSQTIAPIAASCVALAAAFVASLAGAHPPHAEGRSLQLYRLRLPNTWAAALAPDGHHIAAIIIRPLTSGGRQRWQDRLQVWDFRTRELLTDRGLAVEDTPADSTSRSLQYTPDGRHLIYCDGLSVHVFGASNYREIRSFPAIPPSTPGARWEARRTAISPGGGKIAVKEVQWDQGGVTGRELLSVYSLKSGVVLRKWDLQPATIGGFAWSPDGRSLAVTTVPDYDDYCPHQKCDLAELRKLPDLRILALEGGAIAVATGYEETWLHYHWWNRWWGYGITDDPAADVAFLGNSTVATVSGGPAFGPGKKDDLRIWDSTTGKLLRQIASPPNGTHYQVRVSQNGRVLLAYVGKDHRNENFLDTTQQRFRLWDTATWQVLFTSPAVPIPKVTPLGQRAHFDLSADGRLVMVWWPRSSAPIRVYQWH